MEWISIKDRLPNSNINVLVCNIFGQTLDEREPCIAHREDDGFFYILKPFNYDEYGIVNVTHWMPLPDAPEQDITEEIKCQLDYNEKKGTG